MSEKKSEKITTNRRSGFFHDLGNQFKLIFRLMGDRRVNPFLKLIPMASLVYLIFPDIVPGPIDDALIIWLSTYLFVELCPPDVVEEHRQAIEGVVHGEWRDVTNTDTEIEEGDIIEGDFREE